jgi:hypothetical protein
MREAERGPVYQILSKFDDIHRDQKIREKFEVFRHVVFDFNGDYYVAVPLDAPRNRNPEEVKNLQLEAHLLGNLFASFEKEKIFSRVYNPLLSRKVIQKKLWRQGSKFAASQAFRTYRFRDGAWSDIILGAVMGAARRARADRIRQAEEAGPQLDIPDKNAADPAEARAREIVAEMIGEQTADVKSQLANKPYLAPGGMGRAETDDAAQIAAAFGPYADRVNDEKQPFEAHAKAAVQEPISWPYRKPPAPPEEAGVDLLPANSNTSPSRISAEDHSAAAADGDRAGESIASDNVIVMPRPSNSAAEPQQVSLDRQPSAAINIGPVNASGEPAGGPASALAERETGYADVLARAISVPDGQTAANNEPQPDQPNVQTAADPVIERQMPPPLPKPAPKAANAGMNVRITQRTADFNIPISAVTSVTNGAQPIEFIRGGVQAVFAQPEALEIERDQLALDFRHEDVIVEEQSTANGDAEASGEAAQDDTVLLLDAPEDIEDAEFLTVAERQDGSGELITDDELEQISRRFAPKRQAE